MSEEKKVAPIRQQLSEEEMKRRIVVHSGQILKLLQGESGTVGMSALAYSMAAVGHSIGVTKEDAKFAVDQMFESYKDATDKAEKTPPPEDG